MDELKRKAWAGLLRLLLTLVLCVFLPAWTLRYWQGWIALSVVFLCCSAITVYLLRHDRPLLERRLRAGPAAETQRSQKIGQAFAALFFLAIFVLSALDRRFAWSSVPAVVSISADAVVAAGLLAVFFVFRENTFTSAAVEVAKGQHVIATGPYSIVRHPMYTGALLMMLAIPPALGSWWGLLLVIPLVLVILRRIADEERLLDRELPGYREYRAGVRYRLLPFVY